MRKVIIVLIIGLIFMGGGGKASLSMEIKMGGEAKIRVVNEEGEDNYSDVPYFQIYRMRLKAYGEIVKGVDYKCEIQTKEDSDIRLYEGYMKFKNIPYINSITLGQFEVPFGHYETMILEYPSVKVAKYKDLMLRKIDIGLMIDGDCKVIKNLKYKKAIINGDGGNKERDSNKRKDVMTRVSYDVKNINFGLNTYKRYIDKPYEKYYRYGIDLKYKKDPLVFLGEYIEGKNESDKVKGYYGQISYLISNKLMVIAHYGDYNNIIHEIIGSLRYNLAKNTNLQAEYIIYKEKPKKDNNKFIFQTEVTF